MMKKIYHVCIMALLVQTANAQTIYRCHDKDGKPTYQNWPCGTTPAIEQPAPMKPHEIVRCALTDASKRQVKGIATGKKTQAKDCSVRFPKDDRTLTP